MKALVTGAGGFLGGAVARQLLAAGWQVRSFSRGDYPELAALGAETFRGDLRDPAACAAACAGADAVFHVAAKVGMWGPYEEFYAANVAGTRNLLAAARAAGAKKFIFTSTPSVVHAGGDIENLGEDAPYPDKFDSFYAQTKAEAEKLVLAANSAEFRTIALRPHLVWGPGRDQMVSTIIARGRAGKIRRIGAFNKLIDTVYIDDAARAHLLAAEKLAPGAACAGKAYFISAGDPRPNWDVVDMILAAAGAPPVSRSVPYWAARLAAPALEALWRLAGAKKEPPLTVFVLHQLTTAHWFDISAARRDLGYAPQVSIEEGMRRLAAWLSSRK